MKAIIKQGSTERIIEDVIEIISADGLIEGFMDIRYYGVNGRKKHESIYMTEGDEIIIRR